MKKETVDDILASLDDDPEEEGFNRSNNNI